jgi:LPXTG-site transpeptidase (sortase) family protein
MEEKKKKVFGKILNVYTIFGMLLLLISISLILIPTTPYILYRLQPSKTEDEVQKITAELIEEAEVIEVKEQEEETIKEPIDKSLPKENYIIIGKIDVTSPIGEGENSTEPLKKGSWIVPNFGTPEANTQPIIIAAHRFGYIYWDRTTREKISFYNLPKTEVGDTIEIIWGQRKYTYEIYKAEESTYISDYSADLILYTCKYFSSPERIFRYANRVVE